MKRFCVVLLAVFLCLPMAYASIAKYKKDFDIANVVESSKLVVVGRVTATDFVYRDGIGATTDITVVVDDMIKGDPNDGENHVKFMIRGGAGVNPATGGQVRSRVSDTPKFSVNDKVMVMLSKNQNPALTLPHNNYFMFQGRYGKRLIEDNKVKLRYTLDGERKMFNLPIDLVKQIGKSANQDKAATVPIENSLKTQR